MSQRYAGAVSFAALCHEGQVRKGSNTPYIAHPLAVSAKVISFGGDEDQAIAALLHDVVEDCGVTPGFIRRTFGPKVGEIVGAATDGVPDASGKKMPWAARKEAYLAKLETEDAGALLVVMCDKLDNAESIAFDLDGPPGLTVFDRFKASASQTAWYYATAADLAYRRQRDLPPGLVLRLVAAATRISAGARLFNEVREPAL